MNEFDEKTDDAELEELDVEAYAKEHDGNEEKPKARFYVIRIDRERKRLREESLTGREILALVDKTPDTHKLFQKLRHGENRVIEPDKSVNFRTPGIERFQTIPMDTTEGAQVNG